ncbi:hypothetical protein WN944_024680 [Citrus x changshan-huyou]|uniref:Uncharacterized protein n=1 Tax=Citrus x changshan-huyou TaxID=2935761 RepID=A0AAP0LR24_9ROSI
MLMKRGGKIIYFRELGQNSSKLIECFEGTSGVRKIKENYNPATWISQVTSHSAEGQLAFDLCQDVKIFAFIDN